VAILKVKISEHRRPLADIRTTQAWFKTTRLTETKLRSTTQLTRPDLDDPSNETQITTTHPTRPDLDDPSNETQVTTSRPKGPDLRRPYLITPLPTFTNISLCQNYLDDPLTEVHCSRSLAGAVNADQYQLTWDKSSCPISQAR
jgi:hypothetical protein